MACGPWLSILERSVETALISCGEGLLQFLASGCKSLFYPTDRSMVGTGKNRAVLFFALSKWTSDLLEGQKKEKRTRPMDPPTHKKTAMAPAPQIRLKQGLINST